MESRLGRFAGVTLATALLLEGCSNVSTPSPKQSSEAPSATPIPTLNLVNCEKGPYEEPGKIYTIKKGQSMKIGGIIEGNTGKYIDYTVTDRGIGITQDPSFKVFKTSLGEEYVDPKLDIITEVVSEPEKSQFTIGVSATCIFQAPGPQA